MSRSSSPLQGWADSESLLRAFNEDALCVASPKLFDLPEEARFYGMLTEFILTEKAQASPLATPCRAVVSAGLVFASAIQPAGLRERLERCFPGKMVS